MATIGSVGERLNLRIKQGADFGPFVASMVNPPVAPATTGLPVDLTGATIRAQIRKTPKSPTIAAEIECVIADPKGGVYHWHLTAAQTASLPCADDETDIKSIYYWDMDLIDANGRVTNLYQGIATVVWGVTK